MAICTNPGSYLGSNRCFFSFVHVGDQNQMNICVTLRVRSQLQDSALPGLTRRRKPINSIGVPSLPAVLIDARFCPVFQRVGCTIARILPIVLCLSSEPVGTSIRFLALFNSISASLPQ